MSLPLHIELHVLELPDQSGNRQSVVIDLTPYTRSVTWRDAVSAPWGGIDITLALPIVLWIGTQRGRDVMLPRMGDWIVIRHSTVGPAVAWGRIYNLGSGVDVGDKGEVKTQGVSVRCESWMQFLNRVQVQIALGVVSSDAGTLLTMEKWAALFDLLKLAFTETVGPALSTLMEQLPEVWLPQSLAGDSPLSDVVRTIHNGITAAAYSGTPAHERLGAPAREADPIPGPTINALQSMSGPNGTTVGEIITGTFFGDSGMMELFPSLEDAGDLKNALDPRDDPTGLTQKLAGISGLSDKATGVLGPELSDVLDKMIRKPTGQKTSLDLLPPQLRVSGAAGSVLRRNAVLIYRMRPWREMPLQQFVTERLLATKQLISAAMTNVKTGNIMNVPVGAELSIDPRLFNTKTWDTSRAQVVTVDDVIRVTFTLDDGDDVNATTMGPTAAPDNPVRFMEKAGLPVMRKDSISYNGLRLYQPQWPFFSDIDSALPPAVTEQSVIMFMRTMAHLAAQFHLGAARFFKGTATLRYRPDLRHGEIIKIAIPKGVHPVTPGYDPVGFVKALAMGAGGLPDESIICYAEEVAQAVEIQGEDKIVRRTVVTFSRGLTEESRRTVPTVQTILQNARW